MLPSYSGACQSLNDRKPTTSSETISLNEQVLELQGNDSEDPGPVLYTE